MATATARAPARAATTERAWPRVLAIVVTHQGREWLRDCLVALNAQTYSLLDVLVVDDASPDHRQEPQLKRIVKRHLRRRRWGFLRTRRPLGFGGAINWAMSRVRTDADLLLFVHDDAALDARSVESMVARMMMETDTAIVGPKVVAWDDPSRLEEVGMAVDRFGYPYKGLDRGEIDLGQHDVASEVFYVTSTCMLVRHEVFRRLRGWDARMRAFSEDLDLCWRARIAGHEVVVEPRARARHAMALATGRRRSRFTPTRYFIRRNRLRTVAKNVAAARLVALLPQFVLLSFTEMLGFIVLRQPFEILNLVRALVWNLVSSPQTLSERVRVQRSRKVSDGRLRRLTVRETTRLRAYVSHQAERLEDAWGRRAELIAQRGARARQVSSSLGGWPVAASFAALAAVALGFRHFLWSPPVAVGELLPYPERALALWSTYLSPWQPVGLGHPGPASPAQLLLGVVPLLTFGAPGAAQKLLIAVLGAIAAAGAYRLVAEVVDRRARLVSAFVYLLGGVGYTGMREGGLAALAFGAVAPFALHWLLASTGWTRPPGWDRGRGTARVALGTALCCAFVPGAILLLAGVAVLFFVLRLVLGPRREALAGGAVTAAGLAGGWLLLLPWSATWWAPGGPLAEPAASSAFAGHGMISLLTGQTPRAPVLYGAGLALLSVVALVLSIGQRRRLALALAAVVVGSGWLLALTATGRIPAPVASPTEAGVLASAAFAGLAGVAVGAFRVDLPRRTLGWIHALALAALAGSAACLVAGLAPALWRGEWTPGRGAPGLDPEVTEQIRSLIAAEAEGEGPFRILWVGPAFAGAPSGALEERGSHVLSASRGRTLAGFGATAGDGGDLRRAVAAIESGTTDVGGNLLGAFNVRFVVVERGSGAAAWLDQRDLAVVRSEPEYVLLENGHGLARAGLFERLPAPVGALASADPARGAAGAAEALAEGRRLSPSSFAVPGAAAPGVVWLAESADPGWSANLGGRELERVGGGWGNAFTLEGGGEGDVVLSYERSAGDVGRALVLALAWIVVVGAAASKAPARAP